MLKLNGNNHFLYSHLFNRLELSCKICYIYTWTTIQVKEAKVIKNKKVEQCNLFCYNKEKVEEIKDFITEEGDVQSVSELFKILGDPTKIKILLSLAKGELCVCDITHIIGMSLSAVSHQLRILRTSNLVTYRSEGKMAMYSLKDYSILERINNGKEHIKNQ